MFFSCFNLFPVVFFVDSLVSSRSRSCWVVGGCVALFLMGLKLLSVFQNFQAVFGGF